jgi:hypothetical protein
MLFVILSMSKNLIFSTGCETIPFVQGDNDHVCATGSNSSGKHTPGMSRRAGPALLLT